MGKIVYYLNPVAGIVEGFRWSILGDTPLGMYSFILFISSLFYFKKVERVMADIV